MMTSSRKAPREIVSPGVGIVSYCDPLSLVFLDLKFQDVFSAREWCKYIIAAAHTKPGVKARVRLHSVNELHGHLDVRLQFEGAICERDIAQILNPPPLIGG